MDASASLLPTPHQTLNSLYIFNQSIYLCFFISCLRELGICCVWVDSPGSLTQSNHTLRLGGTTPITKRCLLMQTGSDGDSRLKNPTLLLLPLLTLMLQIKQLLQGPFSLVSKLFVFFYYLEKPKLLLLFFGLICFFILSTDSAS